MRYDTSSDSRKLKKLLREESRIYDARVAGGIVRKRKR